MKPADGATLTSHGSGANRVKTDLNFIRGKYFRWIALVLLASLPLLGWWSYGLFDLDEGFYAAVTSSMIRHHEWITPLYNGQPWFEKPILIYWLSKPSIMAFGQAFGPRLPSVFATIATYAIVAWFMRRVISPMAAVLSLFILGSSLLVIVIGRMMMTDAPLLFFFTAAMLAYFESLIGDPKWKLVSAVCLGFGVLAKGPVAIILFVLIVLCNWFLNRRVPIRKTEIETSYRADNPSLVFGIWILGTLLLLALISTWYVPAYFANGHVFVQKFLIDQNIGRFTGGDQAHTMPFIKSFWFYIPILLVGTFPWIIWLPKAWPKGIAPSIERDDQGHPVVSLAMPKQALQRFLAVWLTVVFVFFTISGAKLPHYVLPCAPPIAMLVAMYLADQWKDLSRNEIRPKLFLIIGWLMMSWIITQFGFEYWYGKSGQAEAHSFSRQIREQNHGNAVVAFQLPRRNKALGTGQAKIQETSLPSLSFYTNQDLIETDSMDDVLVQASGTWVFTRIGRVPTGEFRGQLVTQYTGQYYQLLRRQ